MRFYRRGTRARCAGPVRIRTAKPAAAPLKQELAKSARCLICAAPSPFDALRVRRRVAMDLAPHAQWRLVPLRGMGAGIAGTAMPRRRQIFHEDGPGIIIALRIADTGGGLQEGDFFRGLDTFGDHRHAERLAERFDGPQDALAARTR